MTERCSVPTGYVLKYVNGTLADHIVDSRTPLQIGCPDGDEFDQPGQRQTITCVKGNFTDITSKCEPSTFVFPNKYLCLT